MELSANIKLAIEEEGDNSPTQTGRSSNEPSDWQVTLVMAELVPLIT